MKNLLHEFFNSKSDACPLECLAQEKMEKDFQEWFETKHTTFQEAVEPAIRYLFKNHHPHTKIYIDYSNAELLEGKRTYNLIDELPD